ncbi:hypothetical protein O181_064599 [Austropuccinia psidii MF-1]|uniref:Uncharacterized protein n=1 Tax=Austropuccinia psidii MF-1 TaxID=1389203 RepID=A0A9Q3EPS4_9BASI|nr:hypothetical protein [Austropuccinia psidii MF-1]
MKFIRDTEMIKEDFELPERLVTARFNTLFTKSAHRWYIKIRQSHGHQSWTWWKTQIINKWENDAWRFKVETAFESAKFNADKDKALPCFCQQKDRLTALYPDMSEFMIHRKILKQCGGDLEHAIKRRTTEQSSAEDNINILEEVTTRTKTGCSMVNLKTRLNTPWKDSVDKNHKENSNNIKYKPADTVRKCHICQSTNHLANTCPKKGKINEIDIEKEPDVEKDDIIEDNSDDKSSIFAKSSKDIENINSTFVIMELYSHLHSKSFLKTCVPNFEDQLLAIDGIKLNSATNPMKGLGVFETSVIFPNINGNLRITVEYVTMENCSSTHFLFGNDYLNIKITVNKVSPVNLDLEKCKSEQLNDAEISLHLSDKQENGCYALLHDHKEAFVSYKEPLRTIIGHEVDITLNIERPYPARLRRLAHPASPKSREAPEIHITELLDLGVIRKVGHNEEVEIIKPVIVARHNGKSRMVGDFRDLNT